MTTDYEALSRENRLEYGRAIGRIGKMLLADRYDKRTHFIYEVLQNAEDALRRRGPAWTGSRTVTFDLSRQRLRISHFGAPFNEADVRGICGINVSTKDVTAIGRFGIGFKSVYAFSERPEVHSGDESFAIRDYVLPSSVPPCMRQPEETVVLLPLAEEDPGAFDEIAAGLAELGPEALLFLKYVDEIAWTIEGTAAGGYGRTATDESFLHEVQLTAHGTGADRSDTYLLFSRPVENDGKAVGLAEIAFLTEWDDCKRVVRPVSDARLVVFFPTVLPTYTGFLIQGPYQTTPSRDNVPVDKPWNVALAAITADLLVEVLVYLRDAGLLDVAVLRTLPLERTRLAGNLFAPLIDRTVRAFAEERLIPTSTGRFAGARNVRLARAQDVRDLFGPQQLGRLLGGETNVSWVTADITADRAPQLRSFLVQELKVAELTLDAVLARVTEGFLADQSDAWIVRLYRLLATQPALWRTRVRDMPLIRLEDGRQVPLMRHGVIQAFLPGEGITEFPTIRASLCTPQTLKFLQGIGLTKPDPVDDVIRNLLPRYREETVDTSNYGEDIARMLRAFHTDSSTQRTKLVDALKESSIVMCVDAKTGKQFISPADRVYLASSRMVNLFRGIEHVLLLDNSFECLRGEAIREMLEACGATRILRAVRVACELSAAARHDIRRAAGCESCSSESPILDLDLAGLDGLLAHMLTLPEEARGDRARQLWEALAELAERRGTAIFSVQYNWMYHYQRTTTVDACFIRKLNTRPWVPDSKGVLRLPSEVLFEELGWRAHPLLESKLRFKPPAIAALAREVGIDAEVLDELKRLGVSDLAQLRIRLKADPSQEADEDVQAGHGNDELADGAKDEDAEGGNAEGGNAEGGDAEGGDAEDGDAEDGDAEDGLGDGGNGAPGGNEPDDDGGRGGSGGGGSSHNGSGTNKGTGAGGGDRGDREFISYVAAHAGEREADPDGLTQQERMRLEDQAIARILKFEPELERMPTMNTGYDLIEKDAVDEPQRWIEVKAMKGSLADRPVGLSQPQMECARRCGDQYWLYVVEHAADEERARILKIGNPFGKTGTFTFDRGWTTVAKIQNCAKAGPVRA